MGVIDCHSFLSWVCSSSSHLVADDLSAHPQSVSAASGYEFLWIGVSPTFKVQPVGGVTDPPDIIGSSSSESS